MNRLAPLPRSAFVAGLLLVFVGVSVQYSLKVLTPRDGQQTRSAIVRWREQLLALDSDENIYQRYVYPNPPIMALLLRPIAGLPPLTGALVWFYLKVAMTLASLAMVFRVVETADAPFPPWARALTVVLSLRPILGDLTHGNINLFILFLVVSFLYLWSRNKDVSSGVVLALAVACKVTPALFVPYLVWKRSWSALAGCGLGLFLFFFAAPAAVLGWEQNWELLTTWFNNMVVPFVAGGVVTSEHQNQSLPGLVFRLFTESPSFSTYVNDRYTPAEYHNVMSMSPAAAKWLVKLAMGLFVGLVVLTCRAPTAPRRGWRLAAEAAIVTLGMLMFSERTWKHHAVTLLVPFAVLCYAVAAVPLTPAGKRVAVASLILATALMSTTSTGLLPDAWAKLAQVYGAYVAAYAVLMAALASALTFGTATDAVTVPTSATGVRHAA